MPNRDWRCCICRDIRSRNTQPAGHHSNGANYCGRCAANPDVIECGMENCHDMHNSVAFDRTNENGVSICGRCHEMLRYCTMCDEDLRGDRYARPPSDALDRFMCEECYDDSVTTCPSCENEVINMVSMPQPVGDDAAGPMYLCTACAGSEVESYIREHTHDIIIPSHRDLLQRYLAIARIANAFGMADRRWVCNECGRGGVGLPRSMSIEEQVRYIQLPAGPIYCDRCGPIPESGIRAYRINNYSFKPVPEFKCTERDLLERALHFGTEVEIEMTDEADNHAALQQLAEADLEHKLFYCKSDTSVRSGFELVSHPFTYDWMNDNHDAFEAMFGLAPIMEGWKSVRCGMHVHMSTDAFTSLHLLKFMRFFYENTAFIAAVARRPADRLEEWSTLKAPDKKRLQKFTANKSGSLGLDRSSALNVGNSNTIECRIFRSTLAPTAYYGNIEFLQALFDFTKGCGLQELSKDRFLGFVKERSKAYNNFVMLAETLRPVTIEV